METKCIENLDFIALNIMGGGIFMIQSQGVNRRLPLYREPDTKYWKYNPPTGR